jgi:hypothetical protein
MRTCRRPGGIWSLSLSRGPRPSLTDMRAVQITRFGGPEVLDVVDRPDPTPGDGEQLFDIVQRGQFR